MLIPGVSICIVSNTRFKAMATSTSLGPRQVSYKSIDTYRFDRHTLVMSVNGPSGTPDVLAELDRCKLEERYVDNRSDQYLVFA